MTNPILQFLAADGRHPDLDPRTDLYGRFVGSWDLAVKSRPIQNWPSGLRLSRFFTSVH